MSNNEHAVAKTNELKDGEMKLVEVGETKVLLCRVDSTYYAVGGTCTHYGAPLGDGVLSDDRVVCPWHHAAFSVKTGDMLEPPALDSLPKFDVRVSGDDVLVLVPDHVEAHRMPELSTVSPAEDKRVFAIVGAGAAGFAAAQALREDGFKGKIVMITREDRLPYDRPNLSKDYLQGSAKPEWMPLRPKEFYDRHGIELRRKAGVESIEIPTKTITFENGETLTYDKILIATGGVPKELDIPGKELENVFLLRTYDDSDAIIAATEKGRKAVVIGAGFIGMETAFSLRKRDLDVTVVAPESVPFERILGTEIGSLVQKVHEEAGISFRLSESVDRIEGDSRVSKVALKGGDTVDTDLVVIGVGIRPATEFIHGLDLEDDGGIKVDDYFCALEGVYAAGDVANFPDWRTGNRMRIEHWRTAQQQGRQAAHNMAGKDTPYTAVPFFWTMYGMFAVGYVGHATEWDEVIVRGSIENKDFLAFYVKDGRVHAAAGCGRDKELDTVHELLRRGKMPSMDKLGDDSFDLIGQL